MGTSIYRAAPSSEAALEVHNLTKLYGQFRAVDGVSFSVPRGKIIGLLGPNGAGKTTTIQMLVGITLPDGGAIRYFGDDLQSHRQACLQRINFSSSYNNLQGRITVWENLVVFARLYRVDQPEAKIHELGKYFGIDSLMNQRFLTLSAGQRTRVNLVKALLNDPEVILMDEPTASLDPDIADRMLSLIESLRASRDLAIVYTSHQMDEVTRICDEVIFLDHGRIVAQDTPAGLTSRIANTELCVAFSAISPAILEAALRPTYPDLTLPAPNTVRIRTAAANVPAAIFAIQQLGATITDIDIQKPTLEDVFLQIARGDSPASPPSLTPVTEEASPPPAAPQPPGATLPRAITARHDSLLSWTRVNAVLLQELYITARSVEVMVDLPFWSVMTAIVFGFVTKFFATVMNPTVAQYLYIGTLLWEIMRVTQYSMSLGVLWNVWSHNFSNMFITPLSMAEYVVAQMISALLKAVVLFALVAAIAAFAFDVNLFAMGAANLAFLFVNLLWFGYSIGLLILGIIFRLGTRIQALAWGLLLIFQPLTAAYFPLSVMPAPLQAVARMFPPTYVFEAARASLTDPSVRWPEISIAAAENIVYFAVCTWFFRYMYRRSRQTGQFARNEE
ncbi:MAG TPA: ABC transporter ATP-binding protein/permease [Chloroflexota bacterium]|jgi:ABC-2 type transport system ATP-binding protein|nr:ABC transporter ATP-binding protein/permease [Chloroflexota bacterium]